MNVFQYGIIEEKMWEGYLEVLGSYRRKTTFYSDLSIAEYTSGVAGIKDTFNNVMKSWISNIDYITEFVMCLNHKSWEFADDKYDSRSVKLSLSEEKRNEYIRLYADLYEQAYDKVVDYYHERNNEKALSYFYSTLD